MSRKPRKLKMVAIEPKHLGQIDHLHDVQERFLGMRVDRPNLLDSPILTAVGWEDERGRLVGSAYAEATAEFCMIGVSPEATQAAESELAPVLFEFLKARGIRWFRCLVPRSKAEEIGPELEKVGLRRDEDLVVFTRDLRER